MRMRTSTNYFYVVQAQDDVRSVTQSVEGAARSLDESVVSKTVRPPGSCPEVSTLTSGVLRIRVAYVFPGRSRVDTRMSKLVTASHWKPPRLGRQSNLLISRLTRFMW